MAYFVSDAVQRNLSSWALMPVPKALASAAKQAVSAIVTTPSNQTRGGTATNSTATPGAKSSHGTLPQARDSCHLTYRE